jgi:glycosyltransferase involved in cell wall biosynthesis
MKKVTFLCTSYRRFHCVKRIVAQYHAQTYPNKELIIFNTDEEFPYELGFEDDTIKVINNGIDYETGLPYTNRGQICRDAVTHATGDYFMLADDDDIYLPFHIQQAVDGIEENGKDAWKPQKSMFANREGIHLVMNTMEASVIVKMDRIREIGFRSDLTGYEGLSWYTRLRDEKQLDEWNSKYVASYCFNWSDPAEIAGHKQSGDINNPDNFENHKNASGDVANSPLVGLSTDELNKVYAPYFEFLKSNLNEFPKEQWDRYCSTI